MENFHLANEECKPNVDDGFKEASGSDDLIIVEVQVENMITVPESCEESEVTLSSFEAFQQPHEDACSVPHSISVDVDTVTLELLANECNAELKDQSVLPATEENVHESEIENDIPVFSETVVVCNDYIPNMEDSITHVEVHSSPEKELDVAVNIVDDSTVCDKSKSVEENLNSICIADWPIDAILDNDYPSLQAFIDEQNYANGELCVRRSSRIREKRKKDTKTLSNKKVDKGCTENTGELLKALNGTSNSVSDLIHEVFTCTKSETATELTKKYPLKFGNKCRRKVKSGRSENWKHKKKAANRKVTKSSLNCDNLVDVQGKSEGQQCLNINDSKFGTAHEAQVIPSVAETHEVENKRQVVSNVSSTLPEEKNTISNMSVPSDVSKRLPSTSLDAEICQKSKQISDLKTRDEKEDQTTFKPEKVKSRWRRSSELEHGELSGSVPTVVHEQVESRPVRESVSGLKEVLTPVAELVTFAVDNSKVFCNTEGELKPPLYESIEENIYRFERKRSKSKKEVRRMLCDCSLTKEERDNDVLGCVEDCLNRLLMIECGSRCVNGNACSNKRFQKRYYANVQPFKTEKKGWGLKVLEDVTIGSFVIEYVGEVLSRHEFKQRVKQYAREKCNHYYFMALKSDEIIDATYKGNLSRFINHSCSPNCETQKWTVNGELRIGFFATRNVPAGEELTFDYKFQRYGREAQRCHCETQKCTGYIGDAKALPLEASSLNKLISKRKKAVEEKKRTDVLEDLIFEEEVQKLCGSGGLRNREETLILARLMVRAEDVSSRLQLLNVILKTTELACLRLFLDYHGLSVLWSWMVDATDTNLKSKILEVLCMLPIPSKTMLLDSKVLSIVQKWSVVAIAKSKEDIYMASEGERGKTGNLSAICLPSDNSEHLTQDTLEPLSKKQKSSDTSDSETDGSSCMQLQEKVTDIHNTCINSSELLSCEKSLNSGAKSDKIPGSSSNSPTCKDPGTKGISFIMSKSDDESTDAVEGDDEKRSNEELTSAASKLLQSWSSLKEVFRIPRLEQQKRQEDEREADRRGEETSSSWSVVKSEYLFSQSKDSCMHTETLLRDVKEEQFKKEKPITETHDIKDEKKYKRENVFICSSEEKPRKALLPTPPKLTKEERRHLFAMEVQQRDQETLRKQLESNAYDTEESYSYPLASFNECYYESGSYPMPPCDADAAYSQILPATPVLHENLSVPPPARPGLLPTPGFPENIPLNIPPPNYRDIPAPLTFPPPSIVFQQPPPQLPFLGAPPPSLSQPPPAVIRPGPNIPGPSNIPASANLHGISPLQPPPVSVAMPPQAIPLPIVTSCMSTNTAATTPAVAPSTTLQPSIGFSSHSIPDASGVSTSYHQNPHQLMNNSSHSLYYVHTSSNSDQAITVEPHLPLNTNVVTQKFPPLNKPVKLPPNWKTATDPEGNIYYYHAVTRQTQWDPPEFDQNVEDDDGTPTFDEPKPKRKSTTTAAADTSFAIEVAKKIKELFRTKMSSFVVQCLNAYRKLDCSVGRITSTEDFKHLARKLTHFVMAKELKHCKNIEELECNENVKHKAKDYIQKYMSKFGAYYRKDKTSPSI